MSINIQIRYRKRPAPGSAERGPTWVTPPVQYIHGQDGQLPGIQYLFSSTTTMADPGAGTIRLNNATLASVTAIAFDDLSGEAGNPDVSAWVNSFDDSTNTVKGYILLRKATARQNFAIFQVSSLTDNAGWSQVAGVVVAANGSFANGELLSVEFVRSGDNGAYAAADAVAIPALTDYRPVQISGVSKRAYLMDGIPFSFVNALQDGGRFGSTPESNTVTVGTFTSPSYLAPYNGGSFAAGPKFINNNTTYGGSAGALDADVDALIQLMKPGAASAYLRYGPEFYLLEITCGSGTLTPLVVGGVTHYVMLPNNSFPLPLAYMSHIWVKVVSGSLAVAGSSGTTLRRFVDGVEISVNTAYGPSTWHRFGNYELRPSNGFLGYITTIFPFYATPGSVIRIAAPVIALGHAYKGGVIGVIPSAGAIR